MLQILYASHLRIIGLGYKKKYHFVDMRSLDMQKSSSTRTANNGHQEAPFAFVETLKYVPHFIIHAPLKHPFVSSRSCLPPSLVPSQTHALGAQCTNILAHIHASA